MSDQEPAETPLEEYIAMPRGGVAPRCQRRKKNGQQCGKPARTGYRLCPTHGAGFPSREAAGERKKPGRPITHGIYSSAPTRSYADAAAEVASLSDALTSSDRDLLALKSVLVMKLAELEAHAPAVEQMEADLERLAAEAAELDFDNLNPSEAMSFARRFAQLQKPIAKLSGLVNQVSDVAGKNIVASKTRAQTKSKLAETEGLGFFLQLLQVQRKLVHGLAPDENHIATYEMELKRQIFGPNHLEAPPLDL
jgi:hypothetical protein